MWPNMVLIYYNIRICLCVCVWYKEESGQTTASWVRRRGWDDPREGGVQPRRRSRPT
ncbi:hypothetical protein Hanom_Chr07g00631991 [Helianthus anomalus]